ncbi:MAG: hypothetical protein KAW09_09535 [Thermoplasmata archaeon]|nr:hypothetical protein [Thermoplasmata archaeon]
MKSKKVKNTAKRRKPEQSKHNRAVKMEAKRYERKGWKVQADIPGYPKPPEIGGRRPDIKATKPGTTRIVEVETPSTMKSDKDQHSTFRRHAGQKRRTKFILKVTKK